MTVSSLPPPVPSILELAFLTTLALLAVWAGYRLWTAEFPSWTERVIGLLAAVFGVIALLIVGAFYGC
jgi:hypothetical protein